MSARRWWLAATTLVLGLASASACAASRPAPAPRTGAAPRIFLESIDEGSAESARAMSKRLGARATECEPTGGGMLRLRINRAQGAPNVTVTSDAAVDPATYRCMVAGLDIPDPSQEATGESQALTVVVRVEW